MSHRKQHGVSAAQMHHFLVLASLAVFVSQNALIAEDTDGTSRYSESHLPTLGVLPTSIEDRVISGHERRLEQLRKDAEKLTKELAEQMALEKEQLQQLANLKAKREDLKIKQAMINEWKDATFVVASDRSAYAVQADRLGQFQLLAKADLKQGEFVQKIARRFSIPMVQRNDSTFETACQHLSKGVAFPPEATKILQEHWKVRQYLPVSPHGEVPMIVFRDLESSQFRVGYYLGAQDESFKFVSLRGKQELIDRDRIESGTSRLGSREDLLVESEVNMLDVAALEIAKQLGSEASVPTYHWVTVSVKVDELEEALELSKWIDDSSNDRFFDFKARLNREEYIPDQRKEGTRILRRYEQVLHDQLSQRLVELGVPVGNREDLDALRTERQLSTDGDFDQRRFTPLTSASHVVTASVGKPEADGQFRVSIRLNELSSGRTLLEYNSDIGRPLQQYATDYLVHSGSLVLLTDRTAKVPPSRDAAQRLNLASLGSDPVDPRLGVLASYRGKNQFYDLFSCQSQELDETRYTTKLISEAERLPISQRFRWLAWELARAAMPMAGRVQAIDGDRVEINIGSNHGVIPGAVFRVMRHEESDAAATTQVLPFEIKADTVLPDTSIAVVQHDGLAELWPDISIALDDVVLQRGLSNHVVKVEALTPSFLLTPQEESRKINVALLNKLQVERLKLTMVQVGEQVVSKTLRGLQAEGLRAFSESALHPTHIVSGDISPRDVKPDCSRFVVQLKVRSLDNSRTITLPAVHFSTEDINNWKP